MDELGTQTLDLDGMLLRGVSSGGIRTCLEVPSWKLLVDIGCVDHHQVSANTVLVTHAHLDHMGAIANHVALRELMGLGPASYVVPAEIADSVEELLGIWRRLDAATLQAKIVPLSPGQVLELTPNRSVEPFSTDHRVVSQGYLLHSTFQKLRPEFQGLPGPELAGLRKQGATISDEATRVEFAFSGDTRLEALVRDERVMGAKRLVMEATFLDDRVSPERAREMGHIHLDEICEHAHRFRCESLVLTHLSMRYSLKQATEIVKRALPPELAARTYLM
ncbi:MAG: hypothetical protein KDB61_04025 [Planctomycetes bacterium]|nr:hypothetical protein [Planctomycetota bacterium]